MGRRRRYTAVSAGFQHTLFLRSDGAVEAAGWNIHGQTEVPARVLFVACLKRKDFFRNLDKVRFYVLRPPTHTPTHPHTHPRRLAHATYRLEPRAREDAKVYLTYTQSAPAQVRSRRKSVPQKCTSFLRRKKKRAAHAQRRKSRARAQKEKAMQELSANLKMQIYFFAVFGHKTI